MSQVIHGLQLAVGIYDLFGRGAPSTRTDMTELYSAQIGSTYRCTDGVSGSILYVCTTGGIPATGASAGVLSVWTAYA